MTIKAGEQQLRRPSGVAPGTMPWPALVVLSLISFITLLAETLPAGLLGHIADSYAVSQSWAGQTVTVFAIGCVVGAVPLTRVTRNWPRRRVAHLIAATFAVVMAASALAPTLGALLGLRFLAGLATGLSWAAIPSYARVIAPPHLAGRAIAATAMGATLAFTIGVPLGTLVGNATSWRVAFAALAAIGGLVCIVALRVLPPVRPAPASTGSSVRAALGMPAVVFAIAACGLFAFAHTLSYNYVSPLADGLGRGAQLGAVLGAFGVASLAGALLAGSFGDRHPRVLTICGSLALAVVFVLLVVAARDGGLTWLIWPSAIAWGAAFGMAAPLLQTATAHAAGAAADAAQAVLVTIWNGALALGGVVGGVVLDRAGWTGVPWPSLLAAAGALTIVVFAGVARASDG
ncbi:MFS transporter [Flexivirga meconopsidis]|uniref:MFS transporter n=1 Tax=Flexivirga meconopsidis TaxID=2977121 RepID=UPI00224022BF|nr:MFS transporter [Flexivirga meconopsidis]